MRLPLARSAGQKRLAVAWGLALAIAWAPGAELAAQCPVPVGAVRIAAGSSIQAAVDARPAGTAFLLGAGVHSQQSVTSKPGNQFFGERDGACRRLAILSGARAISPFSSAGTVFVAPSGPLDSRRHGRCAEDHPRCNQAHELFLGGLRLRAVDSRQEVGTGRWFLDFAQNQIVMGDSPSGQTVELSAALAAFRGSAANVRVEGLVIEKYANAAQHGAIGGIEPGAGWQVADNEVRLNHGAGVVVSSGGVVRGNHVHHNGQLGVGGSKDGIVVEGNEISFNNLAGFDNTWEGGGAKFVLCTNLAVRNNCVHHNAGPGLWTDLLAHQTVYEDNVVFENDREGIFHEISTDATIRDNRVGRNGRWHPWLYGSNILISTSTNVLVANNQVEVDATYGHGIGVIWQERPEIAEVRSIEIRDNEVTFLGPGGLTGSDADFTSADQAIASRVTLTNNVYHAADLSVRHVEWRNAQWRLSEVATVNGLGSERADTSVQAMSWSCGAAAPDDTPPAPPVLLGPGGQ